MFKILRARITVLLTLLGLSSIYAGDYQNDFHDTELVDTLRLELLEVTFLSHDQTGFISNPQRQRGCRENIVIKTLTLFFHTITKLPEMV